MKVMLSLVILFTANLAFAQGHTTHPPVDTPSYHQDPKPTKEEVGVIPTPLKAIPTIPFNDLVRKISKRIFFQAFKCDHFTSMSLMGDNFILQLRSLMLMDLGQCSDQTFSMLPSYFPGCFYNQQMIESFQQLQKRETELRSYLSENNLKASEIDDIVKFVKSTTDGKVKP